jgi:hypothetical protein
MKKSLAIALACAVAAGTPAWAQTLEESVISQYGALRKSNAAANVCVRELAGMQVERNKHYDTLLRAKVEDPTAPTISEISETLSQTYLEDSALSEKRQACMLLLDEVIAAAAGLRLSCEAYGAEDAEVETATKASSLKICQGSEERAHRGDPAGL